MLSTYTSYNQLTKDLTQSLGRVSKETAVKRETDYYSANIGNIKSIDDFLKNTRIFRYAMKAYGLEDMSYAKAFVRKVLEGGVDDQSALANKLSDPRFKALAKAFDFKALGEAATVSQAVQKDTVNAYYQQQLETEAGSSNEGVRLALYFQRKASSVTSAYGILADKALLQVYQTAFGVSALTSNQSIETQAANIKKNLDIKDLQDPAKVQKLIQKFAARYDIDNNTQVDPAVQLFQSQDSSSNVFISPDLYASMLKLKLGG